MKRKKGSHNHNRCCPEMVKNIFDEDGQEWETCRCCGIVAKVIVLSSKSMRKPKDVAKEALTHME